MFIFHWCTSRGLNFIETVYELFDNPSYNIILIFLKGGPKTQHFRVKFICFRFEIALRCVQYKNIYLYMKPPRLWMSIPFWEKKLNINYKKFLILIIRKSEFKQLLHSVWVLCSSLESFSRVLMFVDYQTCPSLIGRNFVNI